METREILRAIEKLPVSQRMLIVEQTLKTIRNTEVEKKMDIAAETLLSDYTNDKELTEFTQIDLDDFYETR